ncbi:MAG: disulfide bond formation protein B [Candidatus Pacebacteria bacterium]|nr:disulfide bond formation protein B [Candidatus Paceibacterota bacterium]
MTHTLKQFIINNALYLALIQAIVAFLGSMFFSDVMLLKPCVLCWYQRIAMFPLFITLIIGIIRKNKDTWLFVITPAIIGWVISIYHVLLYYKIIPDDLAPCSTGVSCTTRYFELFGFITIPFLAFTAFSVIISLMLVERRRVARLA